MRQKYPHVSVGTLCRLFGKTRNAFYGHQCRATALALLDGLVLVADIRATLPLLGTRKLQYLLGSCLGEYGCAVPSPHYSKPWRPALSFSSTVGLLESHGVALSMTHTATRTKTLWPSVSTVF